MKKIKFFLLHIFFSQNFFSRILRKLFIHKHTTRFFFYKKNGFNFNKVLDIGAYEGNWTKMFKQLYPFSKILMIEANSDKEKILKKIGSYNIAVLGAENNKKVNYYKGENYAETGNSVYLENSEIKFKSEEREIQTLTSLLGPNDSFDLIKMDVQGSELDIIKGGLNIIKNTKFLLIELQNFNYNSGAPRIEVVVSFLKDLDFEFIDVFDLLYSYDGRLIALDGFFINKRFEGLKRIL
jgi:FkbM family methyltransferase